ncbi:hypothetical protein JNB11_03760 [Kocuria palustris]|nr:hypothetical protein [Kocuria palustris]
MSRDEAAYLAEELLGKGSLVTYQMVMDHLQTTPDEARKILESMHQKHPDKFHPKYVIYGSRQGKSFFKFIDHSKLDAGKAVFDKVAEVQLYSLHLDGDFSANEVAYIEYQALMSSKRNLELLPIKGPPICQEVAQIARKLPPKTEPTASRSPSVTSTTKKDTKTEPAKPKSTLTYTSRKRQAEKPAAEISPSSRPKLVYKSRKEEAKTPKERVIVSTDNSKDEAAREKDSAKLQQQLADLQAIFDDDDDFLNEAAEAEQSDGEVESTKISEEVANDKMQIDEPNHEERTPEEATPQEQTPQPQEEDDGAEHTIDEDGYLVRTQKPKKPAPRVTKPTRVASKTATPTKGKGKKKQMDVASFFGK